jgi:5-methylcytosine-specific restriction endonuclease McrA
MTGGLDMPSMRSIHDLLTRNRWGYRFNLSQVGEVIAIQYVVASAIMSCMDGDFYTTLRWRLLRGFMLWFYGRRCMRCGSTYRVEVDHIIARARGEFGREYQWMPRNLQMLCHEHNQEKMIKFDDWRPLWARILMPVPDTPAAHRAEIRAALSPHEYRRAYTTTALQTVEVGCLYALSQYPGDTQQSCDGLRNNLEPIDQSGHWASRKTVGKLATVG